MSTLRAEPAHIRQVAASALRAVADQLDKAVVDTITPDDLRHIADHMERQR